MWPALTTMTKTICLPIANYEDPDWFSLTPDGIERLLIGILRRLSGVSPPGTD
jgi:hypothetical protein